ncbi:aminotransferase class V-fold PLP-dependent enzyme [Halomonas sp. YLB-10]|uniref:aminotransferase class V-fold PLP-dependent enzyme n=1 Tax=Halomonas sp. YLB-10 TaxID=2483111 RepID=UPI000F5E31E1|nr:aminotransferase class V-fold PLP-dependent enzyme [Halomonas sp. YLB-10]RQW70281.1 aminotransferase class V-fold PLP-dependent enzyme [Halomonas sp. YLB-10]
MHTLKPSIKASVAVFDDALMSQVRARFHHVDRCPYTGPRIFFENAGGSLTLKAVVARMAEVAALPDNDHRDNDASRAISCMIDDGRDAMASLLGVEDGIVFGGETGTECLFRVIRAAASAAPAGGNIVACELEHPATFDATAQWARRTGRQRLTVPFDPRQGRATAEDYARVVTPETRVATVLHTSPVTGMTQGVAAIAEAIRAIAPDCYIIVDGIQHAPHGALAVSHYGVDAYAVSLYKVFCPFNDGYAWVSPRLGCVDHDRLAGKPDDAWELGSRDPAAWAGAHEMVRYLEWLGGHFTDKSDRRQRLLAAGQAMHDQEAALMRRLIDGADGVTGLRDLPGVTLIGEADSPWREGAVSFCVKDRDALEIVAELGKRGIRVHARKDDAYSGNILRPLGLPSVTRVSLAHYNTPFEVDACLAALKDVLGA